MWGFHDGLSSSYSHNYSSSQQLSMLASDHPHTSLEPQQDSVPRPQSSWLTSVSDMSGIYSEECIRDWWVRETMKGLPYV